MENIVLIGLMGAGKTTVGKKLAHRIGWTFVDTDQLVEKRCGTTISVIFEVEGEKGFRIREQKIIEEVMSNKKQVIASGGGAPIQFKNRSLLSKGFVVYLFTEPLSIWQRLKTDDSRPILNSSKNLKKTIEDLFYDRDPIYRELADHVVTGGNEQIKQVVANLELKIKTKLNKN
jgi:shikimate kinase